MKTLIKHSLIVAVVFTSLMSYASGVEPLVRVVGKNDKTFTLFLNDLKSQQVKVFIKDENGIVLHNEDLNTNTGYFKKFDLSALPSGEYTLEVEDETIIKVMPFNVSISAVNFSKGDETEVFKPHLRLRGNMVDVMFYAVEQRPTVVTVYDVDGNLLKNDRVAAGQNFEKVFDFSNVESGTYSINFHNGNRIFTEEVEIVK